VFELETYEVFASLRIDRGAEEWMECMVITPPISPPPDRMHILLEHNGVGSTWFDNVLFEELT
jgi:NOL1/NOP2/fmu family ribosome biogenesis protein